LGVAAADIDRVSVPGALEIPLVLQTLALDRRGFAHRYDALVALGAVVRGETYHFELVANGVLTTDTEEQALARAAVKGAECARAAVEMANALKAVRG